MAALSDYLENKLIDHLLRGQAYAAPATLYVALFTSAPAEAGGGTEVSGGAYARVAVASSLTNWAGTQAPSSTAASSGSGGTSSNNVAINFSTPSASWGAVTHIGLMDAASGGNLLIYAALQVAKTINSGDAVNFPIGALTIQLDN